LGKISRRDFSAFQLAKQKDFMEKMNKIRQEQRLLEQSLESFRVLIEKNPNFNEKMDKLQLLNYIKKAQEIVFSKRKQESQ
jgi:lipid II:glycine glycyltransferase (peptidoglycan interpeptide bridge formation enzyme)